VRDDWYRNEYAPRYRQQHARNWHDDRRDRRDDRHDRRNDRDQDRRDHNDRRNYRH